MSIFQKLRAENVFSISPAICICAVPLSSRGSGFPSAIISFSSCAPLHPSARSDAESRLWSFTWNFWCCLKCFRRFLVCGILGLTGLYLCTWLVGDCLVHTLKVAPVSSGSQIVLGVGRSGYPFFVCMMAPSSGRLRLSLYLQCYDMAKQVFHIYPSWAWLCFVKV